MAWLNLVPLLSTILLVITYAVFGWDIAAKSLGWSQILLEQFQSWQIGLEQEMLIAIIHALALMAIVLTSLALTAPVTLMTFFVGSWMKSEVQSIVSILLWSFLFVFVLHWFNLFVEFLVLLSSAILGRIELRSAGFNRLQTLGVLTLICLISFGGGVYGYFHFNQYV
jgi:hypothetical protein